MNNLDIYNKFREVPTNAQKPIKGGRLSGMTDINPMWRIKVLTEMFGPCGVGWKYIVKDKHMEPGANDQIAAFVDIDLFVKIDGVWSEAIPGTGGSMFVAKEKNGMHTSDECYKMATTDALGVACKALGIGADIYWSKDATKYDRPTESPPPKSATKSGTITKEQAGALFEIARGNVQIVKKITEEYGYTRSTDIKKEHYAEIADKIEVLVKEHEAQS